LRITPSSRATNPCPKGKATVTVDFAYKGQKGERGKGADITLSVNGEKVAKATMESTVITRYGLDTFGIGADTGQPVTFDYEPPFAFAGTIDQVTIDLKE
jgi:arylsulfatase